MATRKTKTAAVTEKGEEGKPNRKNTKSEGGARNESAECIRAWMEANDWHFREKAFSDGVVTIRTGMRAHCGFLRAYRINLVCRECDVQSLFVLPVKMTEGTKGEVLEYINRVNYNFRIGKFTIDMRDGEIRWETVKTLADLRRDCEDAMDDLIGFPSFVLDKFVTGLAKVILGTMPAAQAFEECNREDGDPEDETPSGSPVFPPVPEPDTAKGGKGEEDFRPVADGQPSVPEEPEPEEPPEPKGLANYSIEGLNLTTNVPLTDVIAAVKRFRAGGCADVDAPRLNILLSGAPGSGKTAFVKYLAREVGAPLKVVKASDLLSRYSGETEQRIASAFESAKEGGEILFLDEIDSFLQDRAGASRTWEVTQVNELLQQMEEFGGVMVGATNFADNLDRAVIRRFTYKLKLDYLTDSGKSIFFERYFKTPLSESERSRLAAISNLTPGDFRTVREELYYLEDRQDNASRLAALEAESAAKGTKSRIGFAA